MIKQSTQPNAFQSVRPIATPGPSAKPLQTQPGKPPLMLSGSLTRSVDQLGRLRSPVQARSMAGFTIENAEKSRASRDRRHAIVKGGL